MHRFTWFVFKWGRWVSLFPMLYYRRQVSYGWAWQSLGRCRPCQLSTTGAEELGRACCTMKNCLELVEWEGSWKRVRSWGGWRLPLSPPLPCLSPSLPSKPVPSWGWAIRSNEREPAMFYRCIFPCLIWKGTIRKIGCFSLPFKWVEHFTVTN